MQTEHELAEWTAAADQGNTLTPELLQNAKVRFLAAHDQHGITAGAVANLTGPVVGVSNVFATGIGEDEAWAAIPAAVNAVFPAAVIVGYEHDSGLRAAVAAGFSDLGPLRVWLAPPTPATHARPTGGAAPGLSGRQLTLGADPVLELVAAALFEVDEVGALGDGGLARRDPLGLGLRRTNPSRDGLGQLRGHLLLLSSRSSNQPSRAQGRAHGFDVRAASPAGCADPDRAAGSGCLRLVLPA